jgi:hypothetical protein
MIKNIFAVAPTLVKLLGSMAHNGQGLLLCWHLCSSSQELKPNRITDDEDKNKSSIGLRLTEPLLIANKKMRIYSSASIAANPMLY